MLSSSERQTPDPSLERPATIKLTQAATQTAAIEDALTRELDLLRGADAPIRLHAAMQHAVFSGGGRLRPALLLAVAFGSSPVTNAADRQLALASAAAIELLHCASLVHDDMPCFDDARLRRGQPTVHVAFGEPLALLTGDALIFAAMQAVTRHLSVDPADSAGMVRSARAAQMLVWLVRAGGPRSGLVAGQAWELEPAQEESGPIACGAEQLARYHAQKTGALFEAACAMGAVLAGLDVALYANIGQQVGSVYQLLDDWLDVFGDPQSTGKPALQDEKHQVPSAVEVMGRVVTEQLILKKHQELILAVPKSNPKLQHLVEVKLRGAIDQVLTAAH
jgi:geranylgeranyl diphosphate synthase, type II